MALAGHQLARALALALGVPAAQEAAVVEEEPRQGRCCMDDLQLYQCFELARSTPWAQNSIDHFE